MIQHDDTLRLVLESELNPRVFVSPVRDTAGVLVDFRCDEVNRAALRELRANRQDLIGKPIRDLHPSFASELFDLYAQTIETGEALVVDDPAVSHAWLDLRAVRVGDLLSVTWRNAWERHSGQAAESEQWYRLLIENSGDVLVRADNQGALRWVSDSVRDRLGWEPDDLAGLPITELIHPDHVPALQQAHLALLDGEQPRVQLPIKHRDGQWCCRGLDRILA
jgi:PAS domain S-box-containing protein